MKCRHCNADVTLSFIDLGTAPPSNAYVSAEGLMAPETYYPLRVLTCSRCWLVQTQDFARADELFSAEYAYFSSVSRSWVEHAARYTRSIIQRLDLGPRSFVIEVASNDGYLLQHFRNAGVPCLGIEPTASTADACERLGIPVLREFFGREVAKRLAGEGRQADLICGNNVYAHVPDINDFTAGLKGALKPGGTVTLEFPHLMQLIGHAQFDTIYHEHFSYLSLQTVSTIFASAGLRVFDVEEIGTHGGSLRVYGCHEGDPRKTSQAVENLLNEENVRGLRNAQTYSSFQVRANAIKNDLVAFLIEQRKAGRTVAAYGAAAKGNTLLNYGGVRSDLLPFVCDAAPSKQGKYLPGSRIPILPPDALRERRPDFVLILPWNIAPEVTSQCSFVRDWGGRFVVAVPSLKVLDAS
jgi:SAM-dependent methyltransferase